MPPLFRAFVEVHALDAVSLFAEQGFDGLAQHMAISRIDPTASKKMNVKSLYQQLGVQTGVTYPSSTISDCAGTNKSLVLALTNSTPSSLKNPAAAISSMSGGNGADPLQIVAGSPPKVTATSNLVRPNSWLIR